MDKWISMNVLQFQESDYLLDPIKKRSSVCQSFEKNDTKGNFIQLYALAVDVLRLLPLFFFITGSHFKAAAEYSWEQNVMPRPELPPPPEALFDICSKGEDQGLSMIWNVIFIDIDSGLLWEGHTRYKGICALISGLNIEEIKNNDLSVSFRTKPLALRVRVSGLGLGLGLVG